MNICVLAAAMRMTFEIHSLLFLGGVVNSRAEHVAGDGLGASAEDVGDGSK